MSDIDLHANTKQGQISDLEKGNEALKVALFQAKQELKEQQLQKTEMMQNAARVKLEMEYQHKGVMENLDREKKEMEEQHAKAIEAIERDDQKQKKLIDKLEKENRDLKALIAVQDANDGCYLINWCKK